MGRVANNWLHEWIDNLNTTNYRIVVSVNIAAIASIVVLVGVTLLQWEPTKAQERVLIGLAVVLLTMMGIDVLQYLGKRHTDIDYQTAKQPKVNVENVEKVDVKSGGKVTMTDTAAEEVGD